LIRITPTPESGTLVFVSVQVCGNQPEFYVFRDGEAQQVVTAGTEQDQEKGR
jgi:hypothetical protein